MHVPGDLGFSSLVLVVCVVFPVIGFVIRRKWRLAVARQEEIKRLLLFAAEEAARAELEASGGYTSSPFSSASASASAAISVPRNYQNFQCAVCYCPTTTRCARCKSARYCSGKCQIIHWRQGHKEECHPPSNSHERNDEGRDSGQEVARQDSYKIYDDGFGIEGRQQQHAKLLETSAGEPALSNPSRSPEVPRGKDDDIKVEFHADTEGTNSTSESSSTSFSGFSTSPTSGESSDDISVCESISSNEPERSDVPLAADIDTLETTSIVNDVDHTKPLSPKFASLVDSVDNFTKLNKIKPGSSGTTTSSSGLGISAIKGTNAERYTVSSGFWGRTLESIQSRNDDSAPFNSNEGSKSKLSDSGSSLQFSFNLSGPTSSPLRAQGSEVKGIRSDDTLPAALGRNKPTDGVALSENITVDTTNVRKSASLNCEKRLNPTENGSSSDSCISKSPEVKSSSSSPSNVYPTFSAGGDSVKTDASYVSSLPSSSSDKSNLAINNPGSTSHLFKSRELGCLSSSASDAHLSSSAGVHSVSGVKSGKVNGAQEIASCPPNGRTGQKISVWKVVDQFRGSKSSKHNPLEAGSEIAGRYSDKGLFPYESFVKLYNWNKVELQPRGLINCGNSCYANAVLQCLAFTPPLTAYFLQKLHSKACVKKEWCFTCEFENLILKAKEGRLPLSPIGILSQLPNIASQLGNGREEDAHEFLRYAIDSMQSVCLMETGVNASGSLEEETTTLIGLTFGGYLRSKIKCMKCQVKSERHERMMDLTVEIEGDIGTLEEALRRFTGTEILDGENKYQCSRCKSYEKAKKKLTILEAPNVLTIALKRFQSGKFGKLNKSIRFPEILDLAPYMSGTSDKSPVYRLYGVIVHLDIMNAAFSGHYVCYVKNIQNKWFKIDDSTVTAVELGKVLTKGAYMLLYSRCSPRAPRLIRNRIITPDPKIKAIPSRINGKSTTSMSRSASMQSSVVQLYPNSISSDGPASIGSFYSKFNQLQKILREDSSDSSSLLSSNSDEGSCSTDSTRDSTSTDDLSDYIFGDSIQGWNSPLRNSSDSDTSSSSSSSPLYTRQSPLADSDRYASGSAETSGTQTDFADSAMPAPLHSETTKLCRKLASSSSSSSSSSRETDSQRLGWVNPFNDVKSGLPFRKSTRERTD